MYLVNWKSFPSVNMCFRNICLKKYNWNFGYNKTPELDIRFTGGNVVSLISDYKSLLNSLFLVFWTVSNNIKKNVDDFKRLIRKKKDFGETGIGQFYSLWFQTVYR